MTTDAVNDRKVMESGVVVKGLTLYSVGHLVWYVDGAYTLASPGGGEKPVGVVKTVYGDSRSGLTADVLELDVRAMDVMFRVHGAHATTRPVTTTGRFHGVIVYRTDASGTQTRLRVYEVFAERWDIERSDDGGHWRIARHVEVGADDAESGMIVLVTGKRTGPFTETTVIADDEMGGEMTFPTAASARDWLLQVEADAYERGEAEGE